MKRYDVALYGNLTIDHIVRDDGDAWQLGGIANIERHLKKIAPNLAVIMIPFKISNYLISGKSCGELFSCTRRLESYPFNPVWSHLSYADECDCSAGFALNSWATQRDHTIRFGSTKENIDGEYILHNETGSNHFNCNGRFIDQVAHDAVEDIDTLGAGDMLVAEIIAAKLKGKKLKDCLEQCHLNVRQELINRAKKL